MNTQATCVRCGSRYEERVGCCYQCGGFGTVVPSSIRPVDSMWRGEGGEVQSAAQLMKRSAPVFSSSAYPEFKMGRQSTVGIYGPPGGGKSTFMMKWLDALPGPVLYLSLEEGLNESLVRRLRWLEIMRDDFHVGSGGEVALLDQMIEEKGILAVGIDSLSRSTLRIGDLQRAAHAHVIPILFNLHITKDGKAEGEQSIIHDADVVVSIVDLKWTLEKSRFSGLIGGDV